MKDKVVTKPAFSIHEKRLFVTGFSEKIAEFIRKITNNHKIL